VISVGKDSPRQPSGLRVLTLTTLQQAGLTSVRFGLPLLAPFWRDTLHLSLGQVGLLLAAFDLGGMLLFIPIGLLTDRWGERTVLVSGALYTAAVTALIARTNTFWSLALMLAAAGVGYGSGQMAGTKAVAAAFGPGARGTAMGIRQSGLPLGGLIAALLLPVLTRDFGWRGGIAGAAVVCAIPAALCWILLRNEPAGARPGDLGAARADSAGAATPEPGAILSRLLEILRLTGVRRTMEVSMLLVTAQLCYQGYLALYLVDRLGWTNHAAAALLVAVHVGGVLGRLAWGALSDARYAGRRVPALAWCAGSGLLFPLVLIALPRFPSPPAVTIAAFAGGILLLGWNGLYSTLVAESAGPARGATAMGVTMTALYLATMIGLPAFGWLVDHTSYTLGWIALAGIMAAAFLMTYRIPEPAAPASNS
jgi:predicted MFS family arabinose efflux permease